MTVDISSSGNWHPNVLFDRINEDTSLVMGELVLYPRILTDEENHLVEGYLANHWGLAGELPFDHPYKAGLPAGAEGLFLEGSPSQAGTTTVTINAANELGSTSATFDIVVNALPPAIQTNGATQVGSTSALLNAKLIDTGGEASLVSFDWGLNAGTLDQNTTPGLEAVPGNIPRMLNGLNPGTTYYFRAKAINSGGVSLGDAISSSPLFDWPLNDTGSMVSDLQGIASGTIVGATSFVDPVRGSTLRFDGSDDYVTFGDRDEMDSPDRFTVSLWFKREQDLSDRPTNHAVDNVLIAQSSPNSNDNFEIGTDGSFVEVYADSGTAATDATVRVDAGITDGVWHHLALSYGSEMTLYVDGTKVTTWTQYNGRLETSGVSPLSLGIARAGGNNWGEFKGLMQEVRIYDVELSDYEVEILSGQGSIQSFTTGTQPTPPVVRTLPALSVTESNATLGYELVTYDGSEPEIILYWGPVDRGENEGLWANHVSLGNQGVGSGYHVVTGFTPGQDIHYQVQAKGAAHNDWGDVAGFTRTVSSPTISVLPSVDQTQSRPLCVGGFLVTAESFKPLPFPYRLFRMA